MLYDSCLRVEQVHRSAGLPAPEPEASRWRHCDVDDAADAEGKNHCTASLLSFHQPRFEFHHSSTLFSTGTHVVDTWCLKIRRTTSFV